MLLNYHIEGHSPLPGDQIKALAAAITSRVAIKKPTNIGVSFVDEKSMRQLNKHYAGDDYATDVLSFEYKENPESIGDIVICSELAKKQADQFSVSYESELILLLLHGSLHLLGHDHQDSAQTASMEHLQSDIMKLLKLSYRDFKWSH